MTDDTPILVAVGGNALIRAGERGTLEEQMSHAADCMGRLAGLIASGAPLLITHGNGPAVGNLVIQMECARESVPAMPLFIADADSEGWIGFMLQQSLYNHLRETSPERGVVSVVTQVVVDAADPAFNKPTKPVGPFYSKADADSLKLSRGWDMAEDAGRGWRRVVPSPRPLRIVEAESIRRITLSGDIVIAAGGGGVPVVEDAGGLLAGIDAVVDKDLASSLLARQVGAKRLIILTSVDCVYMDYGRVTQERIAAMSVSDAKAHLETGIFPSGSMGPKVLAAADFVECGGESAVITSPERLDDALAGVAGTTILR